MSYYEAEWTSMTPGTQNGIMKNKTDLANIARSEASMTECSLYTLSLKRTEDAIAAGAIKHPMVGEVAKATTQEVTMDGTKAELSC